MSLSSLPKLDFLPLASLQCLRLVSLGWLIVALLEAVAYTVLAYAILHQLSPIPLLVTAILTVIVTILVARQGYMTGVKLAGDLYFGLGEALATAKLSWFTQANRSQVSGIASQSIPKLMGVPAHQLQTLIHTPLLPIFLVIGMPIISTVNIALVTLGVLLLALAIQLYCQYWLAKVDKDRHHSEMLTNEATLELVEHIELLRTSAGIPDTFSCIHQSWQHQAKNFTKINQIAAMATSIAVLSSLLPILAIAGYLFYADIQIGVYWLAVLVLVARAAAPLEQIALATLGLNDLKNLVTDYRALSHIDKLKEPTNSTVTPDNYDIQINNMAFAPVLNQVNLAIAYPTRLQITGNSGSGKTTLLELLLRFDDPSMGQITFGGKPLSAYPYNELVQYIAYVPQEPIILTGTLADNIRLGKPNAPDKELLNIAKKMQLAAIINRSPDSLYQSVGRQGSALSGGERQRVALARALIKNAPILILDEATSALDETTKALIVEQIKQLSCTVIFTTHRATQTWQPTQVFCIGQ